MYSRRSGMLYEYPTRVEGWLNTIDKEALVGRLKNNRWRHCKSQPISWKPYYCVLLQDDRSFTHFPTEEMSDWRCNLRQWSPTFCHAETPFVPKKTDQSQAVFTPVPPPGCRIGERLFLELPRVRLDGGRQAFRRRWGYDMGVPSVPEEDEDSSELSETTSLRDERLLRFSSMGKYYFIFVPIDGSTG
ncbi:ras GTPase-activating protein raskol-like [Stegodyphus dumicola]|uniref:ras GTPase-activating protein raskol-like n=1 Tax=Stegodyphus dumicola TaxID=202533 RepID=UPI0015AD8FA6|nr:ras GTPase-activating protein raskol-like [Stegodyphus dumicola]